MRNRGNTHTICQYTTPNTTKILYQPKYYKHGCKTYDCSVTIKENLMDLNPSLSESFRSWYTFQNVIYFEKIVLEKTRNNQIDGSIGML